MIGGGRREQDIRKELSGSTLSLPVLEIQILSPTKPMCFDTSANWCFFSSNSNSIATKFQISLWNLRINTNLFPINSFILFHNLSSQHKRFGRWSIGEQNEKTDGTPIARARTNLSYWKPAVEPAHTQSSIEMKHKKQAQSQGRENTKQ